MLYNIPCKMFRKRTKQCFSLFFIIFFLIYFYKWSNKEKFDEDQLNGPNVAMNDPRLLSKILNKYLIPPVDQTLHPYVLSNYFVSDPSVGQSEKIKSILNNKTGGFFIEVGALDGETYSNTLYFERYRNWTGLLIEPDPLNFSDLLKKNRRAWLSPTCVSTHAYPEIVEFEQRKDRGRIANASVKEVGGSQKSSGTVYAQCIPLYSYLLALNITHVDYFSLDVEGVELEVLKTIPFQKINIQTLSVEFAHVVGGRDALSEYMSSQGYVVHSEVTHPNYLAYDLIFMKA